MFHTYYTVYMPLLQNLKCCSTFQMKPHPAVYVAAVEEPRPPSVEGDNPYSRLLMSERGFSYAAYRRSPQWQKKRLAALERADHTCQVCNSPHELEVHHRTYERLCKERANDLTVLCRTCHSLFHAGGRILGLYVEEDAVL